MFSPEYKAHGCLHVGAVSIQREVKIQVEVGQQREKEKQSGKPVFGGGETLVMVRNDRWYNLSANRTMATRPERRRRLLLLVHRHSW